MIVGIDSRQISCGTGVFVRYSYRLVAAFILFSPHSSTRTRQLSIIDFLPLLYTVDVKSGKVKGVPDNAKRGRESTLPRSFAFTLRVRTSALICNLPVFLPLRFHIRTFMPGQLPCPCIRLPGTCIEPHLSSYRDTHSGIIYNREGQRI